MLVLSEVALEKGVFQATVAGLKGLLLSQVLLMCSAVGQLSCRCCQFLVVLILNTLFPTPLLHWCHSRGYYADIRVNGFQL